MAKNLESIKYASDVAHSLDSIRSANEELIKLSQRLGRMMAKLQRLETPGILSWFSAYSGIKDAANKADSEMAKMSDGEPASSNPALQSQLGYYLGQSARFRSKVEVLDDILNAMIEDLVENGSFEHSEKEEMRAAFDASVEKSKRKEPQPVMA
jgi:hypothetical protein